MNQTLLEIWWYWS